MKSTIFQTLCCAAALIICCGSMTQPALGWQAQVGVDSPPKDPKVIQLEGIVAQALQLLDQGKPDEAIKEADKALAIDPSFAAAQVVRGRVFNAKRDYAKALAEFDLVTAITGREPEKLQNRADAYAHRSHTLYEQGKFLEAIDNAYFALLEKSDHVVAHNNRALAYVARQDYDKAINSANRAINSDEKSAEAYSIRGVAYAGKGNKDQALKDADKALQLNPRLPEALQRRAVAHAMKGDLANAKKDLDEALTINPNHVDALCDRAYLYGMVGDLPKAMADIELAVQANPLSARAHFQKGLALLEQKNVDQAVVSFDEAIRLQEKHAGAHCFRGYARIERMSSKRQKKISTKRSAWIQSWPRLTQAAAKSSRFWVFTKKPQPILPNSKS